MLNTKYEDIVHVGDIATGKFRLSANLRVSDLDISPSGKMILERLSADKL